MPQHTQQHQGVSPLVVGAVGVAAGVAAATFMAKKENQEKVKKTLGEVKNQALGKKAEIQADVKKAVKNVGKDMSSI